MARYWHRPRLYHQQLDRLCDASSETLARLNRVTGSEASIGMSILIQTDSILVEMMRAHVVEVAAFCQGVWSPSEFLEQNQHRWAEMNDELLARDGIRTSGHMPYFLEAAMDVVISSDILPRVPSITDKCSYVAHDR